MAANTSALPKLWKPICSFFLSLTPDLNTYLANKIKDLPHRIVPEVLSPEKLNSKTEILGVFVDSIINKKVFSRLPNLKLIVTLSTGYDHIDLKEAKRRSIPVCNVPSYGDYTVAQHALMLILALSKKLFQSAKRVKEGDYDFHGLRGFDLQGKTIGIVGTGRIGFRLIQMLVGWDMNVIAYDPHPKKELTEQYNFTYVPFNKLLSSSDIISIHVPLLPTTHHLIDKSAIKKMKKGVHIINTARGGIIDSEALLWGLEHDIIGSAGLDVLEDEDLLEDPLKLLCGNCTKEHTRTSLMNNLIIDHPRTIVTPHNAFNTTEAVKRILDTSVENIKCFLRGETQNNVVK